MGKCNRSAATLRHANLSLSDNPELRTTYKFDSRGTDTFTRMSWDEATRYLARGLMATDRAVVEIRSFLITVPHYDGLTTTRTIRIRFPGNPDATKKGRIALICDITDVQSDSLARRIA